MRITDMTASDVSRLRSGAKPLRAAPNASEEQIQQKAEEFEGVFLHQMLEHMFSDIDTNELFGGGPGEDVYRSFMLEEYAELIVKTGGIGVADQVKAEMLRIQEAAQNAPQRVR